MASIAFNKMGEAELKRYAACWLTSEQSTDWAAAHKLFDPEEKLKQASFKQVTARMFKAYKTSAGNGKSDGDDAADGEGDDAAPASKKKAPAKKRKVKEEENEENAEGDGSTEPPAKKAKAPAKKRKTKAEKEAETAAADAAAIKEAEAVEANDGDEDEETVPKVEEQMD